MQASYSKVAATRARLMRLIEWLGCWREPAGGT